MIELFHLTLDPYSRAVRLILAEYGLPIRLTEEPVWERREDFLTLTPDGAVPVLSIDAGVVLCGAGPIGEYLAETRGANNLGWRLLPGDAVQKAEVRRLVHWCDAKFNDEVTRNIVFEKIYKRYWPKDLGGGSPVAKVVNAGTSNLRHHLSYFEHLLASRNWLAGNDMTWADIAAAAHISTLDYLGHVPWDSFRSAKDWYVRIKSRPSFRPLLADRVPGYLPVSHYDDLDF